MATAGTAIVDFGSTPTDEASVVLTGMTDMTASMHVEVFLQADDTTVGLGGIENDEAAHKALSYFITKPVADSRVAGTGFTAWLRLWAGRATGKYKIHHVRSA